VERGLWIHNRTVPALAGETFVTPNPTTGAPLATLARARRADVELAVASARGSFETGWGKLDIYDRQRILWKVGEILMARREQLARLETLDTGKPLANAMAIDVPRSADTFAYFAGWATKIEGETIPVRGSTLVYSRREALGVVGAIIPWNFPLLLGARKVAAALACGNTVVLKPPEQASLTSCALGEILAEAGAPPGTLNVVTGYGEEAGAPLVDHPDVAKVAFTGGTDTGRAIMRAAAATLKKLSLELGGKSPNLIFADTDLAAAGRAAVSAVFYNQGQICTAGSRLLVERSAYDEVLEHVTAGARALRLGDPLEATTQMGPLISAEHRDRVLGYVDIGLAEGARRTSGAPVPGPGYYVSPTVFADVSPDARLAREEVFGPVLAVLPFETLEEAAVLANASEFGLAAGIWTSDIGRAHALAAQIKAGTVWINTYNRFDAAAPYGGYKQSGFGRENGRAVLDEYTQVKTVWVALG
jgi:aldehyde dehydrogenase (NAD+)/phenylacetaldehyde dehydrogenase